MYRFTSKQYTDKVYHYRLQIRAFTYVRARVRIRTRTFTYVYVRVYVYVRARTRTLTCAPVQRRYPYLHRGSDVGLVYLLCSWCLVGVRERTVQRGRSAMVYGGCLR